MRFARLVFASTVLAVTVLTGVAIAFRPPFRIAPPVYLIQGYVDRAPDESKVIDKIDISGDGQPVRWLLVTSYRAMGGVLLGDYLSRTLQHPWLVRGNRADVARLFGAPAGAAVEGTFLVYAGGVPMLYIADLDQPAA